IARTIEGIVCLGIWWVRDAVLLHVTCDTNYLIPRAILVATRKHLADRILVGPESSHHFLIHYCGNRDCVALLRCKLATRLVDWSQALIERKLVAHVFLCKRSALQQWNSHHPEVVRRDRVPFDERSAHRMKWLPTKG